MIEICKTFIHMISMSNQTPEEENNQSKQNSLIIQLNESDKTAYISGNTFTCDTILIPKTVTGFDDYVITGFKNKSFNKSTVRIINFAPDSQVQFFESLTFANSELESITIPSHVKEISKLTFAGCKKLKSIKFSPDSELQTIRYQAFFDTDIESIEIPSTVTTLEEGWCSNMESLINVKIRENNKRYKNFNDQIVIGKSDINNDNYDVLVFVSRDVKELQIPSFIKIIGSYSFYKSNIEKIDLPNEITDIQSSAFQCCDQLKIFEIHPDSNLQNIGQYCFSGSSIESIYIPKHIKKIHQAVFLSSSLKSVEFAPDNELQVIGSDAFAESQITEITIPIHVREIETNAFNQCFDIIDFNIPINSELVTIRKEAFYNTPIEHLYIPSKLVNLEDGWCTFTKDLFDIKISPDNKAYKMFPEDDGQIIVGKSDLNSDVFDVLVFVCRNILYVTFPPNIKKIAPFAFTDLSITNVSIPHQITIISNSSFSDCHSLSKVEIPQNSQLQIIENEAFAGSAIESIFIPSKVKEIGDTIFSECFNLLIIEFGENSEISSLEKLTFCDSFEDCESTVMIPTNLSRRLNLSK